MNKTEDIERINAKIAASFGKIETGLSEAKNIAGLFKILFAKTKFFLLLLFVERIFLMRILDYKYESSDNLLSLRIACC